MATQLGFGLASPQLDGVSELTVLSLHVVLVLLD